MQIQDDRLLRVRTLGKFELRCKDAAVSDDDNRARQMWTMLGYLLAHRDREITREELMKILWPQGETGNPENALKNLAYRVRMLLIESQIPDAQYLVIYKRGIYRWNSEISIEVDCERFASLFAQAQGVIGSERQKLLKQAEELYQGPYLPKILVGEWISQIRKSYQEKYISCVCQLAQILEKQEQYEQLVELCKKAVCILPFVEDVYLYLIRGCYLLHNTKDAIIYYHEAVELFYKKRGCRPSEAFAKLYHEIAQTSCQREVGIQEAKHMLEEESIEDGAFCCEFEVFKELYQLKARSIKRTGQTVFLLLITMRKKQKLDYNTCNQYMERLLRTVKGSLRRGDAITRFSTNQYLVMLPLRNYEEGRLVQDRVFSKFAKNNSRLPVELAGSLEPVDPT